jgi:hypothetical protein
LHNKKIRVSIPCAHKHWRNLQRKSNLTFNLINSHTFFSLFTFYRSNNNQKLEATSTR